MGTETLNAAAPVPPSYLNRQGFFPRKIEDFGDGGAFPEIHIAQFPFGKSSSAKTKILPVTVDSHGNILYDAIVMQNENSRKIVYSQYEDIVPMNLKDKEDEDEEIEEITAETKAALEKKISNAAQIYNYESKYIKFKERIIRMVEMHVDPLEPPKSKHKRVPRASGSSSPPVPVLHSPPRPVSVKDQQDWKIPPCISNWKNPKGYTIPLDKRLAATDVRNVQIINDNFAKLSESLYVSEKKAREEVELRCRVKRDMALKEKDRKEQELRSLAQSCRSERKAAMDTENEQRLQRETIRRERGRERKNKSRRITRDSDRDVSEKVALGIASVDGGGRRGGGEVMYDERLFNQEKGMDSGFVATDDQYNVYDKGLFTAQPTLSTLYKPRKDIDVEMYGGGADEQMDNVMKTDRFKPDKGFFGASESIGAEDPFELDELLTKVYATDVGKSNCSTQARANHLLNYRTHI